MYTKIRDIMRSRYGEKNFVYNGKTIFGNKVQNLWAADSISNIIASHLIINYQLFCR